MLSGTRVVRGPDWKYGNQDGGEGHVGTIVECNDEKTVCVIWDSGRRNKYHAGQDGLYDLRIYDTSPTGVKFKGASCSGCNQMPLFGMRWQCLDCIDYDLCTKCYMSDQHDIQHQFKRFDEEASGVIIGNREGSEKIEAWGIFPGAKVVLMNDWKSEYDNICDENVGEVTSVTAAENISSQNNIVNISYIKQGRLGYEGKVDMRCTMKASGGFYYTGHLPVLGKEITIFDPTIRVGDFVQITLDLENVKSLQAGHGEWTDGMEMFIRKSGKVCEFNLRGDAVVLYDKGVLIPQKVIYNPDVLMKVPVFTAGQHVRIKSDINFIEKLQEKHGGWNIEMRRFAGKVGEVVKVDDDLDVFVSVFGKQLCWNPLALERTDAPVDTQTIVPRIGIQERQETESDKLYYAAGVGDLGKVQSILQQMPDLINDKPSGLSSLHWACKNGKSYVVEFLLSQGADIDLRDEDGNTALHHTAIGGHERCTQLLLGNGASLDVQNDKGGHTAFQIASMKSHNEVANLLLQAGCNINTQDLKGKTPLHTCITKSNREMITLLCTKPETDLTILNKAGLNVLHHAAEKGNTIAVDLICSIHPELVNIKNKDGKTPLHLAAMSQHCDVVSCLAKTGNCDLNQRDGQQMTALMLCVLKNDVRMVEVLVENGSDVNAQDKEGNSPLHMVMIRLRTTKDDTSDELMSSLLGILGSAGPEIGAIKSEKFTEFTKQRETLSNLQKLAREIEKKKSPGQLKAFCERHGIICTKEDAEYAIACYLVEKGADTELHNNDGETPFQIGQLGVEVEVFVQEHLKRKSKGVVAKASTEEEQPHEKNIKEGKYMQYSSMFSAQLEQKDVENAFQVQGDKCTINVHYHGKEDNKEAIKEDQNSK